MVEHLLSVPKAPGSIHSQEYKGIMTKKHRCVFIGTEIQFVEHPVITSGPCVGYSSVAVMKHNGQKQLMNKFI